VDEDYTGGLSPSQDDAPLLSTATAEQLRAITPALRDGSIHLGDIISENGISNPALTLKNQVEQLTSFCNEDSHDALSLAFRQTIERLGATAAIITFARTHPVLRRQAFFISFDNVRHEPRLASALLNFSEHCWEIAADRQFLQFHKKDIPQFLPENQKLQDELPELLDGFGHFVFSVFNVSNSGCLRVCLLKKANTSDFDSKLTYGLSLVQPMLAELASTQLDAKRATRRIGIMEGMLDAVSHGILLLDERARPFYCNGVAHDLMAKTGAIIFGQDQTLRCRSPELTRQLHLAVEKAIRGGCNEEMIIKLVGNDDCQMLGFIMPAFARDNDPGNRAVILMIHQMKIHAASPALMKVFGLLPSEQRFLSSFLEAASLNEAALKLGLSEETARTYLKRVCAKLGVRRQIELASLMFGLASPIRSRATENADAMSHLNNRLK
jgi:DNA-binding CsgD family transcriptional regulator/PAS domain-containing protein